MEQVRTWVLTAGAVVLALLILATLVRAVLGPRFTANLPRAAAKRGFPSKRRWPITTLTTCCARRTA